MNPTNLPSDHPLFWSLGCYALESYEVDRAELQRYHGKRHLQLMQARKIRRSFMTSTGLLMSQKDKAGAKAFEGPLEMAFLTITDFDWLVEGYEVQPCEIQYRDRDGKERRYFPDVLINFSKHNAVGRKLKPLLVEVKSAQSIEEEGDLHTMQTEAGHRCASEEGWNYQIFSEAQIYTPYWRNAKFFRRYARFATSEEPDIKLTSALLNTLEKKGRDHAISIEECLDRAAQYFLSRTPGEFDKSKMILELMPFLYRSIRYEMLRVDLRNLVTTKSLVWRPADNELNYSLFG